MKIHVCANIGRKGYKKKINRRIREAQILSVTKKKCFFVDRKKQTQS
jgi:hypothetical protein